MKWWRVFGEMFIFRDIKINILYMETLTVMMIPCHWDWECERQPPYVNDNQPT